MLSEWGEWGACSATCGANAVKERRRMVKVKPKWGGMDCSSRREKQSCRLQECSNEKVCVFIFYIISSASGVIVRYHKNVLKAV